MDSEPFNLPRVTVAHIVVRDVPATFRTLREYVSVLPPLHVRRYDALSMSAGDLSDNGPIDEARANFERLIEHLLWLEAEEQLAADRLAAKLLEEQDESPSARSE